MSCLEEKKNIRYTLEEENFLESFADFSEMGTRLKKNISSQIPGIVTVDEASKIIKCSKSRIYQYISSGKLGAKRFGTMLVLPLEEVRNFQRGSAGRQHESAPPWRVYRNTTQFVAMIIYAQIRPGMQERFQKKLEDMRNQNHHTFTSSFSRSCMTDGDTCILSIIWKKNDIPDKAIQQQDLLTFQQDFADVLDWVTAEYVHADVPLLT